MKRDIATRQDLVELLTEFYSLVIDDSEIGHHFVDLDLESHLPKIVNFWEKIIFGNPVYFGNPLQVHQKLYEKSPLEFEHFVRWVTVFGATVDRFFEGDNAELAKTRAKMIGHSLNQRLNGGVQIQNGR